MTFYRPENYIDPNARVASGDTPPPMTRKIGFVTQSPGDLFLASKGLTSQTKGLVTFLQSATEIQTSRNEAVIIRDQQTGQATVAIDVGPSLDPAVRELLVLAEPAPETTAEAEAVASNDDDYGSSEAIDLSSILLAAVLNQHAEVTNERQASTIENASPTPSQYVAPAGSYTVPATSYTPAPTYTQTYSAPAPTYTAPSNSTWQPAGAYVPNDYEASLLGTA